VSTTPAPSESPTPTPPEVDGVWLRPSGTATENSTDGPRWGHSDGMHIGIPPIPGPRGLIRIFTPYLDHPRGRLVNFIAVEPIPAGASERGYSELEASTADPGMQGKRLWSGDSPDDLAVRDPRMPAAGTIDEVDGVERLTVWLGVERFDNGADVQVRARFRADRPREVEVAGFTSDDSVPLSHLVLTATMGNWSRLRRLELADRVVEPRDLWPGFSGTGFAEHARFDLAELRRDGEAAVVSAVGDEEDPWSAVYSDDTAAHWHFLGRRARQTWRVDDPHPELQALVNARWSYWASASEIPGGPSFENFEVVEPFRQGAAFRFSVDPLD